MFSRSAIMSILLLLQAPSSASAQTTPRPSRRIQPVTITLPADSALFPPGPGSELANSYCLTCHSLDMVLTQPPLTLKAWTAEINKMRNAFGAVTPESEVQALASYLTKAMPGR